MDSIGSEVGQKMRSAIKAKLLELECYVDEELPDYIMVMVANKRSKTEMKQDLGLFLNSNTGAFVDWLHVVLKKLKELTVTNADLVVKKTRKVTKRKSTDARIDLNIKKEKIKKEKSKKSKNEKDKSSKSLTDDLPLNIAKISNSDRKVISTTNESIAETENNKTTLPVNNDSFDIPLLAESAGSSKNEQGLKESAECSRKELVFKESVDSSRKELLAESVESSRKELEDIEQKIKSVKSRLGILDTDKVNKVKREKTPPISYSPPLPIITKKEKEPAKKNTKEQNTSNNSIETDDNECILLKPERKRITFSPESDSHFANNRKRPSVLSRLGSPDPKVQRESDFYRGTSRETESRRESGNRRDYRKESDRRESNRREFDSRREYDNRRVPDPREELPDPRRESDVRRMLESRREMRNRQNESQRSNREPHKAGRDISRSDTNFPNRRKKSEEKEGVMSRLGVMSKVQVAENKPEEVYKEKEVKSMIKITPRRKCDASVINKNILLRALSDAQKSMQENTIKTSKQAQFELKVKPRKTDLRISLEGKTKQEAILELEREYGPSASDSEDDSESESEYDCYFPRPLSRSSSDGYEPRRGRGIDTAESSKAAKRPIVFDLKDEENLAAGSTRKERCKFWPNCKMREKCEFAHPTKNCDIFPKCKFGEKCMYLHPKCKFGESCTRRDCIYMHTKPTVKPKNVSKIICKFSLNCGNAACPYNHPKLC